jgi:signal transduction histidine kinase
MVSGLLWGALAWLTLSNASSTGSVLVVAMLAGLAGGSISIYSPLLPVSIVFFISVVSITALKMFSMNIHEYNVLGIIVVLYMVILFDQARNSSRAARDSINLSFENIDLIEKLRQKTEIADSAKYQAEVAQYEAEQANIAKSKFLAAASHDLRQPIHAQGLFLDVLSRTNLTAKQNELVAHSCAANEASAEMLNTLLDFSRIEAGVIETQVQAFRLQPLLNKIESEFACQADAKGLSYRSRETNLVAQSDPALLELIMRNLVSNAIRYTNHGGLLVTIRKRGDHALLEVRDTGIGIELSKQRDVFREFHQLGNPERDRRKGLGLGLAIVAGLSRSLNHDVSLTSIQHRGSMFRVTLPISSIALSAIPLLQQPSKTGSVKKINRRVLVIDDDEAVRTSMLHLMRDWGCECDVADSIEEAIVLVQLNVPDVIISDYRLREQCTGADAIAALRIVLSKPLLPALLISGDTSPKRLREAHASGIPLMHKPVSPSLLYSKLVSM